MIKAPCEWMPGNTKQKHIKNKDAMKAQSAFLGNDVTIIRSNDQVP